MEPNVFPFPECQNCELGDELNGTGSRIKNTYCNFLQLAPCGIIIHDGTIIHFANQAMAAMLEFASPSELIGKRVDSLIHADDLPISTQRFESILHKEKSSSQKSNVYRLVRSDREIVYVESMESFCNVNGKKAIQSTFQDITDKRESEKAIIDREKALLLSEKQLKEAQRMASLGSWEIDLKSESFLASDEFFRIFEFEKLNFKPSYLQFLKRVHPADRISVQTAYRESIESFQRFHVTHRLLMPDGRIKHVVGNGVVEYDGTAPVRFIGTVQDISIQKKTQIDLNQSERKYRLLFEQSPDAVIIADTEFLIPVEFNPASYRMLGYTPEEFSRLSILTHNTEDEIFKHVERISEILRIGTGEFQTQLKTKTGEIRDIEANVSTVEINDLKYFHFLFRDITERRAADIAIRESEQKFRQLAENIEHVLWLGSFEKVFYVSPSYENVFGLKVKDLYRDRRSFARCILDEDKKRVLDALDFMFRNRVNLNEEFRILRSGEIRWIRARAFLFSTSGLGKWRCVGIAEDITERKRALEAIETLNRELESRVLERTAMLTSVNRSLETFTYSVSHDLKAPLRSIEGYSRLLSDEYSTNLNHDARGLLANIRRSVKRMNQLIEDLLAFSRIDYTTYSKKSIDLRSLCNSILADFKRDIEQKNITFSFLLEAEQLLADEKTLKISLRNLIANAIKFSRSDIKSKIDIISRQTSSSCVISVRDNGIGFDMKHHDRIFQIFQRLHTDEKIPGTGLGLAIVRKAVERMAGRVWAKSEPDGGSEFFIEIQI